LGRQAEKAPQQAKNQLSSENYFGGSSARISAGDARARLSAGMGQMLVRMQIPNPEEMPNSKPANCLNSTPAQKRIRHDDDEQHVSGYKQSNQGEHNVNQIDVHLIIGRTADLRGSGLTAKIRSKGGCPAGSHEIGILSVGWIDEVRIFSQKSETGPIPV
jgi:hypothetical protein